MNQMLKLIVKEYLYVQLICTALFTTSQLGFSHGTVTYPPSRIWICYQENPENPDSPACIASVASHGTQPLYDWNAINQANANGNHMQVVPDSNLASGGRPVTYGGMDQVRSDWVTTPVTPGPFTVTWTNSAPHATAYYDVYITKASWTPNQPLTWNNLTLLVRTDPSPAASTVDIPVTLPSRTGHHVIYSVWQRSDSPEAFYSTSDIDFGGSGGGGAQPILANICGDLKVDLSATIKKDLTVDSTMTVGTQIIQATNPQLTFRSGSDSIGMQYKMTYQNDLDKFTIEEVGTGVVFEIKDGDIYLTQYATGGEVRNLCIDANGKIVGGTKPLNQFSRYNFSLIESFSGYKVTRLGIHFADSAVLTGINAFLLDNNTSPGNGNDNSIFVNLKRRSKISNIEPPELIYQILGANTSPDVFSSFSSNSLIIPGSNIISNSHYIYYLEIYYCDDCDFREVSVLE
jgi:predicted carbohydrate-binding protein with CBM5 and CBM33 domain